MMACKELVATSRLGLFQGKSNFLLDGATVLLVSTVFSKGEIK